MISLIMLATACRAWLELTRDSFSRSSLEIRVRCISALNFLKIQLFHVSIPANRCEDSSYFSRIN